MREMACTVKDGVACFEWMYTSGLDAFRGAPLPHFPIPSICVSHELLFNMYNEEQGLMAPHGFQIWTCHISYRCVGPSAHTM